MPTVRIYVRCNAATGLWVADCPQFIGVRASAETIEGVVRAIYRMIPPEWRLASQRLATEAVRG